MEQTKMYQIHVMSQAQALYLCCLISLEEGETAEHLFLSQAMSDMAEILL